MVKPIIEFTQEEEKIIRLIGEVADTQNVSAYLIGGFVRDKILNRPTKDIDVVCVGNGIELATKVAASLPFKPKVNIFKTYGTAQLKLWNTEVEFVGARKESYHEDSRNPEVFVGTLEEDQLRRDFTINALAISINKTTFGDFLDPFDGLIDLEYKIIRTPLSPAQTFSDDPLRMMRAIRFAAQLQFNLDQSCFDGIQQEAERIKIITKERISDELNKIMMCPKPSIGFDLLFRTGLLKILLPQLAALAGTEIKDNLGHKDNFYHSIQVVDNLAQTSDNLWLRWAALLHDIGKAVVKDFDPKKGWTFHGHEVVSSKMVPKIFANLKLPIKDKMEYVKKIVGLHHRPVAVSKEEITDSAIRRLLFDAGDDIDDLMKLCEADITSKNKHKVKKFLENFEYVRQRLKEVEESDKIRNWQPPISGEEIMRVFGIGPSQDVGTIKTAIREAILDGEIPNDHQEAYEYMISIAKKLNLSPVAIN